MQKGIQMNDESFTFDVDFSIYSIMDAISGLQDMECPYLDGLTGITISPDGPGVDWPEITVTGPRVIIQAMKLWYEKMTG